VGDREEEEQLPQTVTRRTRLFLAALGTIILAVVTLDVLMPPGSPSPIAPAAVSPSAPEVRRGLNKTPLLYAAEFSAEIANEVSASFVAVEAGGPGGLHMSRGVAVSPHHVLAAPVVAADTWRVVHLEGHAHEVTGVAIDAVHGVALLTVGGAPLTPLPLAGAAAPLEEPVVLLEVGDDVRVPFPVVADPPLAYDRLEERMGTFTRGAVAVSLESSLLAFVASSPRSPRPIAAPRLAEIVTALRTSGRHAHPWTGVEVQQIDASLRARFPEGALVVVHVASGSPAPSQLVPGTVLSEVRARGAKATTETAVRRAIADSKVVSYVRPDGRAFDVPVIDRQLPFEFEPQGTGALVSHDPSHLIVAPMSRAAARGLRTGDIVRAVDLRPVRTPAQVDAALRGTRDRLLTVQRGEGWRFIFWSADVAERRP
jgi:hypothetical protein